MKECTHCNHVFKDIDIQGKVNHILHLLISFITVGTWVLIWCYISRASVFVCSKCNKITKLKNIFPSIVLVLYAILYVLALIIMVKELIG